VERAAGLARGRIAIKGNVGVMSGAEALAMLRAGAACVDLYAAFVYRGWSVARDINGELLEALQGQSVAAAGAGAPARQRAQA
jgi:dihydroorotate dehydrogenase